MQLYPHFTIFSLEVHSTQLTLSFTCAGIPCPFLKTASCSTNYYESILGNVMSSFDFLMAVETVKTFFILFFFKPVNVIIVTDEDSKKGK